MQKLLTIALISVFFIGCTQNSSSTKTDLAKASEIMQTPETDKKQLRHVVMFKFKEGSSATDIAKVEAAFTALPGKIPEIKGYEWGTNNSPEGLEKGFTHCFFLTFDSEEGRAAYLPHPDHKAFGDVLGPHLDDVMVLDYWAK